MQSCHAHHFNELFFLVQGNARFESNADSIDLCEPSILFFNRCTLHRGLTLAEGTYERYKIYFYDDLVRKFPYISAAFAFFKESTMTVIRLNRKILPLLLSYYQRMEAYAQNGEVQDILTSLILFELYQYHTEENTILFRAQIQYVNDVLHYLSDAYGNDISLDGLAAKFFISRAKLVKDFKLATGTTVHDYLTLVRVQAACGYLQNGCSVSQTARCCGYNNDSHFITQFRRFFGITPGKFQRYLSESPI